MKIFRKYQRQVFNTARKFKHIALLLEMRLGKTLIIIRIIKSWGKKNITRILIVLPVEAIDDWIEELNDDGEHSISILMGTKKERIEKLSQNNRWNFVNYKGATQVINKELLCEKWDVVILDESVKIKNPKTNQSKFFVNNFRSVPHRVILSGCWNPEDELEIIQQINFVDNSILRMNYWSFRQAFCYIAGFKWKIKSKEKIKLFEKLSENFFMIKRKDVGLDKEEVHTRRFLELPKKLKKAYNTIEDMMVLELDGLDLSTMHTMQSFGWLKQLSAGIVEGEVVDDFKLKELMYLLENDLKGEQFIISSPHKQELYKIEQLLKKNKYKIGVHHGDIKKPQRTLIKNLFKSNKLQGLLVNPETMKFGVNVSNCDTIIHFSLPESFDTFNQFKDRILDVDSDVALLHIYLITRNTIDEIDYYRITKKKMRTLREHALYKKVQKRKLEDDCA